MGETTRIGIVGAGQIVENAHLPVLLNQPGVEVRWVADRNAARAALLSKMFSVQAADLARFEDLLTEVDVCLLATPVGARRPYLDLCAERGKAALAEKPFAVSAVEHRAICDRFPEHALGASFQRRFYASMAAIGSLVDHRPFGALEHVGFAIGGFDLKSGGPTRYLGDPRLSGGGVVMELGVHVLDQVLLACRATGVRVESTESIAFDGLDYDMIVETTLDTAHGAIATRGEITRLRPLRQGFAFRFENATVSFGLAPNAPLTATPRDGGPRFAVDTQTGGATTINQAFFQLWHEFLGGLRSRRTTPASACTSTLTATWVDAIYEKALA